MTLPYWDWSRYATNPFSAPLWSPGVLGGDGDTSNGYCVSTGPFQQNQWFVQPLGTCLRREFSGTMASGAVINQTIATPVANFAQFESSLRLALHNRSQCNVGGTMCLDRASNAPEYWLFTGFTDSIWSRYQNLSTAHQAAFFSTMTSPLTGTGGTATPQDFVDNSNLPGGVCVEYQTSLNPVPTGPPPTTATTGIVINPGGDGGEFPGNGGGISINGNTEEEDNEDSLWSL